MLRLVFLAGQFLWKWESALVVIRSAASRRVLGGGVGVDLERHVNQYRVHKNNIWGFYSIFILDSI